MCVGMYNIKRFLRRTLRKDKFRREDPLLSDNSCSLTHHLYRNYARKVLGDIFYNYEMNYSIIVSNKPADKTYGRYSKCS